MALYDPNYLMMLQQLLYVFYPLFSKLDDDSDIMLVKILNLNFIGDADVWLRSCYLVKILKMNLIKICV